MNIYRSDEMYKLAYSKSTFEQEKQKAMEAIYKAAELGQFQTCFLIGDFTDYRLVIAWLAKLGYRCIRNRNDNRFYVKWEGRI
jgi:hypothetical protein